MAYTALARKYRSRTFDDVIGQKPIATTLVNAIKTERIHHGYLFTGTRGVGKTSMARILAKALNCLKADAPTTTPCCECEACVAIGEGQDIDVVEIDAASNTGVDNIRELRSNTAYRPARSRFKVYIIDEVHMLSTGAFNALLKTLEEPPEHVKFILATTEIQKVPATIRSRCLPFNFRHISPDDIAARLTEIAKQEGAEADDAVTQRVARLANGSMRDALSILDQLLSVSPEKLTADVLDEIVPPAQDEQVFKLLEHAAADDAAAALTQVEELLAGGRGLEVFCNDLIEVLRTLMLVRACGPDASVVDFPAGNRDEYVRLAARFELSHYVQMIGMVEELRRNVRFSSAGRALTDAVVLRLSKIRAWTPIEKLLEQAPAADTREKKKSRLDAADSRSPAPLAAGHRQADARFAARPAAGPATASAPVVRTADRAAVEPLPRRSAANGEPAARTPVGVAAAPSAPRIAPADAGSVRTAVRSETTTEGYILPEVRLPPLGERHSASALEPPDPAPTAETDPALDADAGAAARQTVRRPVSSQERERILNDPVVRQAVELFDGVVVNMEIEDPPAPAANADEQEVQNTE